MTQSRSSNGRAPEKSRRVQRASRMVLLLGFGAILALLTATGLYSLQVLSRVEERSAAADRTFLEADLTLDQLRTSFYTTGTSLRDYLLDPDPAGSRTSLDQLTALRADLDSILKDYSNVMPETARDAFRNFQRGLRSYWLLIDPVLTWDHEQRQRDGFNYLKKVVFPKRQELIAATMALRELNDRHRRSVGERLVDTFRGFRLRLLGILLMTVAMGIFLGALTSYYILRIERDLERQNAEISEARTKMEELSAGIVEAQEEERRRIARELHDEVGQSLSALLVDVGNAAATPPHELDEMRIRLASVRNIAETCLHEVRNLSLLLRPSMLDDFGLVPALHWLGREFERRYKIPVLVKAEERAEELPDSIRTCVYRVVQEALGNVARHAQARKVQIWVRQQDSTLVVVVEDDGRGFDTALVKGMGLLGMQERARRLGGVCRVESAPGKGAVVQLQLPARTEMNSEPETEPRTA